MNTGSTQFGGRLEVYFSNSSEWGTVCDDSWSSSDATVACRQMGFVGVSVSDSSRFGSGASTQNILLDDVACRGSESQLIDCNYDGHTADCSHSEDVGIVCTNGELGWDGSSILIMQYIQIYSHLYNIIIIQCKLQNISIHEP